MTLTYDVPLNSEACIPRSEVACPRQIGRGKEPAVVRDKKTFTLSDSPHARNSMETRRVDPDPVATSATPETAYPSLDS